MDNQVPFFKLINSVKFVGLLSKRMKYENQKLVVEFGTVFAVALGFAALVTLLWNFIGHGKTTVDWETSFRFSVFFGIILTWVKSREIKEK